MQNEIVFKLNLNSKPKTGIASSTVRGTEVSICTIHCTSIQPVVPLLQRDSYGYVYDIVSSAEWHDDRRRGKGSEGSGSDKIEVL
jgi:hypothetical protein